MNFTTEKLTAAVIALIAILFTVIILYFGNQETILNSKRIENGYTQCQRIGQTGTIWVKGSCTPEKLKVN